ncbi:Cof-type HAD-IIB family hydrolase [Paenibacillus wulumuqiensis]|uniref:Cof-type HAD-IIB family hydrolase n=1 Tax=Paenibacillus wulumuqiensis TaxID=1567107 RepID=UPI000619B9A4|nr:Cof-type HAD-IIB family hydrolase [Paenibacillus wulumuqiensis]
MNYRLIALDMDGTLLDSNHEISPKTAAALQEVAARGTEIVLCTGRTPVNSIPYMEQLGLHEEGYVIVHNGAATVHTGTREVIHQFPLDTAALENYMHYCRQHDIHFDINTAFEIYVDSPENMQAAAQEMYAKFQSFQMKPLLLPAWEELSAPVLKLSAFASPDQLDTAYKEWSLWTPEFNILRSGEFFIDLMHPRASKGDALQALAESRGIAPAEIMAIGNYYNDVSMIQYAGLGIAVDNSPLEVKAAADEVTYSNDEEGVYHMLQKYAGVTG